MNARFGTMLVLLSLPAAASAQVVATLNSQYQTVRAYCDPLDAMPDKAVPGDAELFGMKMTKLGVLALNVTHDFEHYGNFVTTLLRIKGLVPPSSQGSGM